MDTLHLSRGLFYSFIIKLDTLPLKYVNICECTLNTCNYVIGNVTYRCLPLLCMSLFYDYTLRDAWRIRYFLNMTLFQVWKIVFLLDVWICHFRFQILILSFIFINDFLCLFFVNFLWTFKLLKSWKWSWVSKIYVH